MANEPDLGRMTTALAIQGIESSELALDLILHDIAERARLSTGASGAAIALERQGAMVCRAAAGGTAPDLGVSINAESGLTGACVREERAQWCPDTDADDRVDAEACRQLQVRSIVVVPLFARERVIGVFEIFSGQPRAFGERELRALQELAVWVTEAIKGDSTKSVPSGETVADYPSSASVTVSRSQSTQVPLIAGSVFNNKNEDRGTKVLRAVVLGLAVLLCVLLGFRWGWQKARLAKDAAILPAPAVDVAGTGQLSLDQPGEVLTSNQLSKPSPASKRASDNAKGPVAHQNGTPDSAQVPGSASKAGSGKKENASDREVLSDSLQKPGDSNAAASERSAPLPTDQPTTSVESTVPLPAVVAGGSASVLPPLSAAVPDKPTALTIPVSRGVTAGRLIRRVNPTYPSIALQQRIAGAVQLVARVGTDGRVHDIKVLKGHPFLATAAIDAVRQWQYEPYKLNGQAVDLQTQITINFNLP